MTEPSFTIEQLTAVATLVLSLCAVLIVVATIATARREVLGPRRAWLMLAASVWLLSLRVLGHFDETPWLQTLRSLAGIVAAVTLPFALYSILKHKPTVDGGASS